MSTPFGPQLVGELEKTLNALLRRFLEGTGLSEPEWVTMRVAQTLEIGDDLARAVEERAHFTDAESLVAGLTARNLLVNGSPTAAGLGMTAQVQARIASEAAPIWHGHAAEDVATTTRILNEVLTRARLLLA